MNNEIRSGFTKNLHNFNYNNQDTRNEIKEKLIDNFNYVDSSVTRAAMNGELGYNIQKMDPAFHAFSNYQQDNDKTGLENFWESVVDFALSIHPDDLKNMAADMHHPNHAILSNLRKTLEENGLMDNGPLFNKAFWANFSFNEQDLQKANAIFKTTKNPLDKLFLIMSEELSKVDKEAASLLNEALFINYVNQAVDKAAGGSTDKSAPKMSLQDEFRSNPALKEEVKTQLLTKSINIARKEMQSAYQRGQFDFGKDGERVAAHPNIESFVFEEDGSPAFKNFWESVVEFALDLQPSDIEGIAKDKDHPARKKFDELFATLRKHGFKDFTDPNAKEIAFWSGFSVEEMRGHSSYNDTKISTMWAMLRFITALNDQKGVGNLFSEALFTYFASYAKGDTEVYLKRCTPNLKFDEPLLLAHNYFWKDELPILFQLKKENKIDGIYLNFYEENRRIEISSPESDKIKVITRNSLEERKATGDYNVNLPTLGTLRKIAQAWKQMAASPETL